MFQATGNGPYPLHIETQRPHSLSWYRNKPMLFKCDALSNMDQTLIPTALQELRDSVVEATLDVYKKVMSSLLPTPTKSHYTFNLRDISRVMQGFLMMGPELLGTGAAAKDKYLRLWVHEVGAAGILPRFSV